MMRGIRMPSTSDFFLERYGLSPSRLESTLGRALGGSVDHADIYFEHTTRQHLELEQGKIRRVVGNTSQGVGVRALCEEKMGYAHSDEITVVQLECAAANARAIAEQSDGGIVALPSSYMRPLPHDLYALDANPLDTPLGEKAELLRRIDTICREYDHRICDVAARLTFEEKKVFIVSREGWMIGDSQPLLRLNVSCVASDGTRKETAVSGGGGRIEYGKLLEGDWYRRLAENAARLAVLLLSAEDTPAGSMTVVLGPGWPGILLHEAVGHGLEGDFNRKDQSAFAGRLGQRVASELCTVVDDGTIPNRRGSLNFDDEGTPTRRNVLIERGILVGYMQDLLNARLMGMAPTGNGRRESYAHPPMPRMTNTFMLAGETPPEDIIRSVKRGLYAVNFSGGSVDITNGNFVFSAVEAYLIEGGRITKPVKGATLVGNGPTALTKVSLVGDDLALDQGVGTCGKDGQTVPVGVGLPTIRIDEMTVGGTDALDGDDQ